MAKPQTHFSLTLPTTGNGGTALVGGELTSITFTVQALPGGGVTQYGFSLPSGTLPGAAVDVAFAALSPPFVPVAGTEYSASVFATDAAGNGDATSDITWTQAVEVPKAPTGFSVG